MFLFPAIASVVLFLLVWRMDLLRQPYIVAGCVLLGAVAQVLWTIYSLTGFAVAAALVNIGFALYFAIRLKLS